MQNSIVRVLLFCVTLSALGGFGSALLCPYSDKECTTRWQNASIGSLTSAASLGTLLAKLNNKDETNDN